MVWPAIIGAAAGLIGSRLTNSAQDARQAQAQDFNSQEAQLGREFNAAEAEKQRVWSADQAAKQMAFQERLSGTAYQRAMSDMRTAGLNPILAYSQGGASTPSGAMGQAGTASAGAASSPAPAAVRNSVAEAVASATQLAQLGNIEAQTKATEAQARKTDMERLILEDQEMWEPVEVGLGDESPKKVLRVPKFISNMQNSEQIKNLVASRNLTNTQQKLVFQEIFNAQKEERRIEATTRDVNANAVLRELAEEQAKNEARFHRENPTWSTYSHGLKSIGDILNSAGRLKGLFQ